MKVFRCREVSPTYCPEEVTGETVEEVIAKIKIHAQASHGLGEDDITEATVALWRARIRDLK